MIDCKVCDGGLVVVLGGGARADFFDCPVCVGYRDSALNVEQRDDMLALCKAEGVVPKKLRD